MAPELEAFDATATVATADGAATLFRGLRVRCAVVEGPDPPADQALRSLVSLVPGGVTVVAFPAEMAAHSPCSTARGSHCGSLSHPPVVSYIEAHTGIRWGFTKPSAHQATLPLCCSNPSPS